MVWCVQRFLPEHEDDAPEMESHNESGKHGVVVGFFAVQIWPIIRSAYLDQKLGDDIETRVFLHYMNIVLWATTLFLTLAVLNSTTLGIEEQDYEDSQVQQSLEEPLQPRSPAAGLRQRRNFEAPEIHIIT